MLPWEIYRVSVNFCSEINLLADVLNAPWHSDRWNDGQMEERAFQIKPGVTISAEIYFNFKLQTSHIIQKKK